MIQHKVFFNFLSNKYLNLEQDNDIKLIKSSGRVTQTDKNHGTSFLWLNYIICNQFLSTDFISFPSCLSAKKWYTTVGKHREGTSHILNFYSLC